MDEPNPDNFNWDYNAPIHVVDFARQEHEKDNDADKYFGKQLNAELTTCIHF